VCRLWPGITPWNVWELPYDVWIDFAYGADEWLRAQKEVTSK
jgi:hypothetical protein